MQILERKNTDTLYAYEALNVHGLIWETTACINKQQNESIIKGHLKVHFMILTWSDSTYCTRHNREPIFKFSVDSDPYQVYIAHINIKLVYWYYTVLHIKAILRDLLISAPSIYILLKKFSSVYINR